MILSKKLRISFSSFAVQTYFMKTFCFFIFSLGFFISCSEKNEKQKMSTKQVIASKSPLIKANRGLVNKENAEIDSYVSRRNWTMQKSGSGLRYYIYKNGNGKKALAGNYAQINYSISLLNGIECYRSKDKPERFLIDRDNVESGLHEGIKLLREGDKAILILPPHLAHGLIGDQEKIPPLSTIVYDIELVAIK